MPKNELLTTFGDTIRELRESQGWSQEQFAVKAGLHRTYIGSVERGERNITLNSTWRIAEALNISASSLLTLVEAEL